jgi:hypothetical protein
MRFVFYKNTARSKTGFFRGFGFAEALPFFFQTGCLTA